MKDNTLYVISVISNPARYGSRYNLYKQFEKHMLQSENVKLITVEIAFGTRAFEVTQQGNPLHIQLRTYDELWHKENMINVGIKELYRIDPSWEYMAWVDADVQFVRQDWALETINQLQHHMVVQMFSTCIDMGPKQEVVQTHKSFAWCWRENMFEPDFGGLNGSYYGGYRAKKFFWHPGYAWSMRREAVEALYTYDSGPLLDYPSILGSGDHSMALALIGHGDKSYPADIHPNYAKSILLWQQNALEFIKKDIGYVDTIIMHSWHGKKADRKYVERWDVLRSTKFNPETDLKRDHQGLLALVTRDDRQRKLRDLLREYSKQRNEDSIDL